MIGVTAAASALVYMKNGFCDFFITAPVVLGTLAGSYMGARMMNRVRGVTLKKTLMLVLTLLAARMISSGLGF
jgi:uncharacterized membrane protein YfcA